MKAVLVTALLTVFFGSITARANHEECKADVEKFCAGVEHGGGHIIKCLHKNKKSLSPECAAKMAEAKKEMKEAFKACKGDKHKFCKDVKHGHGAVIACFKEHEAELSAECKKELEDIKKNHEEK